MKIDPLSVASCPLEHASQSVHPFPFSTLPGSLGTSGESFEMSATAGETTERPLNFNGFTLLD
jgi:hypothetical protein